jgi:hypothetical protein
LLLLEELLLELLFELLLELLEFDPLELEEELEELFLLLFPSKLLSSFDLGVSLFKLALLFLLFLLLLLL